MSRLIILALSFLIACGAFADVKHGRGLIRPADWKSRGTFVSAKKADVVALPASFDWRIQKTLSPITDQGACGSCWDFSASSTFRDAMIVQAGMVGDASEKWVIDCNPYHYSCQGGYFDIAGMFTDPGMVRNGDYAVYNARQDQCRSATPFTTLMEWHYVPLGAGNKPDITEMKNAIYNFGPINVGVAASGSGWDSYKGGVYSGNCNDSNLDHAVQLVGWNDSPGYWIMRNSWGTGWGDRGFMMIPYGCDGIGESAVYYVYKGSVPPPTPNPTPVPPNPPCALPAAGTGHSASMTATIGKTIVLGIKGTAGVSYRWTAQPAFDNNATPTTAQINYKPRISKTITVTATNSCGSASASTSVNVPYANVVYQ